MAFTQTGPSVTDATRFGMIKGSTKIEKEAKREKMWKL